MGQKSGRWPEGAIEGFSEIIEHSPDGVVVHRQAEIVYSNRAATAIMKLEEGERLEGKNIFDFVVEAYRPGVIKRLERIRETRSPTIPVEIQLRRPDGGLIDVESSSVAVTFGGAPAVASMIRDIRERKRLNARLMSLDRMVAAGTLASGVGHEINNPLTYVVTNLEFVRSQVRNVGTYARKLEEVLRREMGEKEAMATLEQVGRSTNQARLEQIDEAIEDAQHGGQRIKEIVEQLRGLARSGGEERSTANPEEMVESAVQMAINEIRYRAEIEVNVEGMPAIRAEESKLGQVVLNLLINAAHSIEPGAPGEHRIAVEGGVYDEEKGLAFLRVSDSGEGIAEDHRSRIFDPFFSTRDSGLGTGLGLHICQTLVRRWDGFIEVESEVGEGSCFEVVLPICEPDEEGEADERSSWVDSGQGRSGRVLIIDDEVRFGEALKRNLGRYYPVKALGSGREALEELMSEDYDLILCNLMMPEMTGVEFYHELEARDPEAIQKLVFISGGAYTARSREFLNETGHLCLNKPLQREELEALVRQFLGGR